MYALTDSLLSDYHLVKNEEKKSKKIRSKLSVWLITLSIILFVGNKWVYETNM